MRDDATKLRAVLGLEEPESARTRDEAGRFTGSNDTINQAIRGLRGVTIASLPSEPPAPADGVLGAGRGHTNEPTPKLDMNALLREAAGRA